MIGIPTAQEPLLARSPLTAEFDFLLGESPDVLGLNVIRVTDQDELDIEDGEWRWWRFQEGEPYTLPLNTHPKIEISLEPGLYVLSVFPVWHHLGGVTYGFLLRVKP